VVLRNAPLLGIDETLMRRYMYEISKIDEELTIMMDSDTKRAYKWEFER
jgi:hypothetical protein